jgi:hypothetical protein
VTNFRNAKSVILVLLSPRRTSSVSFLFLQRVLWQERVVVRFFDALMFNFRIRNETALLPMLSQS